MNNSNLQTISVDQLKLGMTVHGIAEQAGKLVVKHKGTIRHQALIEQLQSNGVISVFVEQLEPVKQTPKVSPQTPRQDVSDTLQKLNEQKQARHKNKATPQKAQANRSAKRKATSVDVELQNAAVLIDKGQVLQRKYIEKIENGLEIDASEAQVVISEIYDSLARNPNALLCLSLLMNSHDYLAKHAVHVSVLMCFMAQRMMMSEKDCERLGMLGFLFDIGMCKVPKHILNKKGPLTQEESVIVKGHVEDSLNIVKPLNLDSEVLLAIEQHHERLDGSGYPNGYSGSKISKFARMLSIADSFDALTATRPFAQAKSPTAAMKIINTPNFGYDTKLVLQFIKCMGIYPVGSLVLLSNKRIGLVTEYNQHKPSKPTVNVFYSVLGSHYLAPKIINLSTQQNDLHVLKPVLASQYNLDVEQVI